MSTSWSNPASAGHSPPATYNHSFSNSYASPCSTSDYGNIPVDVSNSPTNNPFSTVEIPGFEIAVEYYQALGQFLENISERNNQPAISQQRKNARDKLNRLSKQQFQELGTDVYDEMMRRVKSQENVPFLPVRDDFHPKRNQARQKLATLPKNRFKDLAADVFFELEARFPALLAAHKQCEEMKLKSTVLPLSASQSELPSSDTERAFEFMTSNQELTASLPLKSLNGSCTHDRSLLKATQDAKSDISTEAAANSAGNVNFQNLDALMADLGNMMEVLDRMGLLALKMSKKRYESQILKLQQSIVQYQSTLKEIEQERVPKLEMHIEHLTQANAKLQETVNENTKEIAKLINDLHQQTRIATDAKRDADQLASKLEMLQMENDELKQAQQKEWNASQQMPKNAITSFKVTSPKPFQKVNLRKESIVTEGAVSGQCYFDCQQAVNKLLMAIHSPAKGDVLMAMKMIVFSCKTLTDEIEAYESNPTSMTFQARDNLQNLKVGLTTLLTNLMKSAKAQATGSGSLPKTALEIEKSARELAQVIQSIVELIGLQDAPSVGPSSMEGGQKEVTTGISPTREDAKDNQRRDDGMELNDLRLFLEKRTERIVQGIQQLLQYMRNPTFDGEFHDAIRDIITIVDQIVEACRSAYDKSEQIASYREAGRAILDQLVSSSAELANLGNSIMNDPTFKPSKQKLASISYDVARYTKELVGLMEK